MSAERSGLLSAVARGIGERIITAPSIPGDLNGVARLLWSLERAHPMVSPPNPRLLRHAYENHAPLKELEHPNSEDKSPKAPQDDSKDSAPFVPSATIKRPILLGRVTAPRNRLQIVTFPPFLTIVAHTSSLDLGSFHLGVTNQMAQEVARHLARDSLVFRNDGKPRDSISSRLVYDLGPFGGEEL